MAPRPLRGRGAALALTQAFNVDEALACSIRGALLLAFVFGISCVVGFAVGQLDVSRTTNRREGFAFICVFDFATNMPPENQHDAHARNKIKFQCKPSHMLGEDDPTD